MKSRVKLISGLKDWNRDYDKLIPKGTAAAKSMNGEYRRKWDSI